MRNIITTAIFTIMVASALSVLTSPILYSNVNAEPTPKTTVSEKCSDPKFADRASCPGNSEDAGGNDREDIVECDARNPGQAKNCPEDSEVTTNRP